MRIKDRPQSAMSLFKSQIQNVFNLKSNPAGKRGQSLKFLENCNIFTIVGKGEALIVKREANEILVILTGWIIMAFLAFAPKRAGARMGAVRMGLLFRLFNSLPLYKFSPTSELFSLFFPCLPRWKAGLSTASCSFGGNPQNRPPLVLPGEV